MKTSFEGMISSVIEDTSKTTPGAVPEAKKEVAPAPKAEEKK